MDRLIIRAGSPLSGTIPISGAKNAALPLMAASLLTDQKLVLQGTPALADIKTMARLLRDLGVKLDLAGAPGSGNQQVTLQADRITDTTAPYDHVRKMRASILVLGPLLARCGEARVSLPGGCAIGTRPVDLHIEGLRRLGAEIELEGGYVVARAPNGLKGASVTFPKVSVGATENLLMAAALAEGETTLVNAAREPEIGDLARCLILMGAEIDGLGSDRLVVRGSRRLEGATHKVIPDRIEAGTYAMAAAMTGGEVVLTHVSEEMLPGATEVLMRAGVDIARLPEGLRISRRNGHLRGVDVMTEPFPGFPTDLQAQIMALMTTAEGASLITETIFENRFMHAPELSRMGASITVHHASALVRGVPKLTGAPVMATDLRASVSLVIAGLVAEGETILNRVYHLDRGYEDLVGKLNACGASIERAAEEAA